MWTTATFFAASEFLGWKSKRTVISFISSSRSMGVVPVLGVAVEASSSVSDLEGRSAGRAEKRLKSFTIVVTGLVERLRATHVEISLKFSAD